MPRRNEVESENLRNFNQLSGSPKEYECLDLFIWRSKDEPELKKKGALKYPGRTDGPLLALKDHRFEERIQLRVGMLVILLANLSAEEGLVNGSQGRIIGFEPYDSKKGLLQKKKDTSQSNGNQSRESFQRNEQEDMKEEQMRAFINRAKHQEWPIVQFPDAKKIVPIYANCQLSELGSDRPYSIIGRTQIPLLAAWYVRNS